MITERYLAHNEHGMVFALLKFKEGKAASENRTTRKANDEKPRISEVR